MRYTAQKKQELISRHQLCERLVEFGWVPNAPEDLGEDFIVHIYFQGQATGVLFHVQEKSVTNLNERHKNDHLVYDLEVKDLKHWENFSLPVVLVIWDINLREGRWVLVNQIVAELNQQHPRWRENKSKVRVQVPWKNTTNDTGLIKLKQHIGRSFYPLITKDKSLGKIGLKFSFPNTEEGKEALGALERHIKEGDQVIVEGKFIQELGFPEWWLRWFGEYDPDEVRLILSSSASSKTSLVYVDVITDEGTISQNVELRVVKSGTELLQLSNDHQASPLHLNLIIRRIDELTHTYKLTWRLNNWGRDAQETRHTMKFLRALALGGKLRLTIQTPDKFVLPLMDIPPQPEKLPSSKELELLDKLCFIQDKTGQLLQVPPEGVTDADVRTIAELAEIIEYGKTVRYGEVTGEFKNKALEMILEVHRQGKPLHFRVATNESFIELFNLEISTGRMTRHVTGALNIAVAELEKTIAALNPDEFLSLKIVDAEIIEIFPDWFEHEARRLSQVLLKNYEAEAVYLFGSLIWNDIHTPEADIDLAVRGISPERYLEAIGYLERESKFPVDLVDLDSLPHYLHHRILTEGKLLDGREPIMATG